MHAARRQPRTDAGFSVVELLVVIGILIAIISSLVVGLGYASRQARVANTEFLMNTIMTSLVQFRTATGYLPPVLGDPRQMPNGPAGTAIGQLGWCRDGIPSPEPFPGTQNDPPAYGSWSTANVDTIQRWRSATTIPEYLLGPGNRAQDGYGVIMESGGALPTNTSTPGYREQPALGIRSPGADGLWGAVLNPRAGTTGGGLFAARNLASNAPAQGNTNGASGQDPTFLKGQPLGPFLEAKSESDIGAVTGFEANGTPIVARSGEINDFDAAPKCILDYFGKPILYYRRGYLNGDPKRLDRRWTLADVIALRPTVFGRGEDVDAVRDANNDTSASRAALSAECALLSFGPDTRWDPTIRADPAGYNEDNIVRFGP